MNEELMNSKGVIRSRKLKYPYFTELANGMTARVEHGARFGLFNVHLLRDIASPLMLVADITDIGHSVKLRSRYVTIRDLRGRYQITIPISKDQGRLWVIPFSVLVQLTNARAHFEQAGDKPSCHQLKRRILKQFSEEPIVPGAPTPTHPMRLRPRREQNQTHYFSATLNRTSRYKSRKVHELHERMGLVSAETMCRAIEGESTLWRNTEVTPDEVRAVF
jgi:hypothetical protein